MTTDTAIAPTNLLERVKTFAAVIGAVVGAITALWGVYEKVRSEARKDTAASYNTLAPQVNQMGEVLKQLQAENQKLRQIVAEGQGRPRLASVPPAARKSSSSGPSRPARAAAPAPGAATSPGGTSDAGVAATAPGTTTPPAAAAPAAPPGEATPAEKEDAVTDLLQTVGKTRAAIETLRKVPEDFGRMLDEKPKPEGQ